MVALEHGTLLEHWNIALLHGFAEKPKVLEDTVMMPLATHTRMLWKATVTDY